MLGASASALEIEFVTAYPVMRRISRFIAQIQSDLVMGNPPIRDEPSSRQHVEPGRFLVARSGDAQCAGNCIINRYI